MSHSTTTPSFFRRLQEFSIPLLAGTIAALVVANCRPELYQRLCHEPIPQLVSSLWSEGSVNPDSHIPNAAVAADSVNEPHSAEAHQTREEHSSHSPWAMLFLVNDLFMVFFFGIAAKEITESCLPGGALNPIRKAINPLFGTLGGVLGPVGVYLPLNAVLGQDAWTRGWGIPTATDIALAWLVARLIFGKGHPAISFLLLLAIADDAIGLAIIALAYPDPAHPVAWLQAAWLIPGIAAAFAFRRLGIQSWLPYVLIGGSFCWWGLHSAHLHPALALVFVVPWIPGPRQDIGLFLDRTDRSYVLSPLERFEHDTKCAVDFGLFFFAFANAGVPFAGMTTLTWIVLLSLIVGKTLGVTVFSWGASRMGFPLPYGISLAHLLVIGMIAGLGLTVALFVSNQAFTGAELQGAAKMGALLSLAAGLLAFATAQALGVAARPIRLPKLGLATSHIAQRLGIRRTIRQSS